jgi:hypothetical protein
MKEISENKEENAKALAAFQATFQTGGTSLKKTLKSYAANNATASETYSILPSYSSHFKQEKSKKKQSSSPHSSRQKQICNQIL